MKKRDLLLVIDLQNIYMPGQEWACPSMPQAIRNICRIIDSKAVDQVIFTRFDAPKEAVGTWKRYNEANEAVNSDVWLNDMADEIKPYLTSGPLYSKSTYSSLRVPEIVEAAKWADRILLAGVVAECCVLSTLMEAIDDGIDAVYLTDCCAGQSDQNEQCIKKIAESFAPLQTQVMSAEEYINSRSRESLE